MPNELSPQQRTFLTRYLGAKLPDGAGPVGTDAVRKRGFLVSRWQRIPAELNVEIATLTSAVEVDLPHEDAAGFSKALDKALSDYVAGIKAEIDTALDDAINSGDQSYLPVAGAISKLRSELSGNSLMAALRGNALAPDNGIERAIASALDEVEAALVA